MVSIIIPTLNEEDYLPLLLESIKKQNFSDYEVIVADAGSKDKTKEIAKSYGCKVIKGGLPARGRNEGVKVAKRDLLLFLDADSALPKDFLKKFLKKFKERKLDLAVCFIQPFGKNKIDRFLYDFFHNYPKLVLEKVLPNGYMPILIKKSLHQKIRGFDEEIKFAEDTIYVRKASKYGRFEVLRAIQTFSSQRRFQKDGWLRTFLRYILAELHMIFFGPIKSDILKSQFNHYLKNRIDN